MANLTRWSAEFIASVFFTGRARFRGMPFGGLVATVTGGIGLGLLNYYGLYETSSYWYFIGLAAVIAVGIVAANKVSFSSDPDPKRISIDELAGIWTTMAFVPGDWWYIPIAIAVFRTLDVLKPFGIRRIERLKGGWGVMFDDIASGVLGSALINAVRLIVERFV